ncbi:MAG: hypothetical protein FJY10_07220 [Bacteroidetes bacterium]|nr:hypothetical protein [Bacteroidota bacterium]
MLPGIIYLLILTVEKSNPMKKQLIPFIVLEVFTAAFMVSAFQTPTQQTQSTSGIPDSVYVILKKACMACHSDQGTGLAKGKLNLSPWDGYSADRKVSKARAICKEMKAGTMPPRRFVAKNPEAQLTDDQIRIVCDWTASLSIEKNN